MNVEAAIRAFASAGNDLPRDAMRWALDNWDEAAPTLLDVLTRFADGADRSDDAANATFFILHLAAEKRDTRTFAPLCGLARDAEAIEAALGDGITTTLARIIISTYDGDLDALKGVLEAAEADEFVRTAALEAQAYLTAIGRVPRDEMEAYLLRLYDTLQPQSEGVVWTGWVLAVAHLGFENLSSVVERAFRRGLIDPKFMSYDDFRTDLERTRADPERMVGFRDDRAGPLDNAIGELSGWYGFSEEAKRDRERGAVNLEDTGLSLAALSEPYINPLRTVGRNDPCPCGSGKKFKKCCLQ